MNSNIDKKLNIAGRLSLVFINHPLTFIFGIFILALGYISLILMPREENPQIKVSGGVVIVALPGAKPSEIQKVIIEPLEKKIKEIKGVENIYSFAKDSSIFIFKTSSIRVSSKSKDCTFSGTSIKIGPGRPTINSFLISKS